MAGDLYPVTPTPAPQERECANQCGCLETGLVPHYCCGQCRDGYGHGPKCERKPVPRLSLPQAAASLPPPTIGGDSTDEPEFYDDGPGEVYDDGTGGPNQQQDYSSAKATQEEEEAMRVNLTTPGEKENFLIEVAAKDGPAGILQFLRARRDYAWLVALGLKAMEVCIAPRGPHTPPQLLEDPLMEVKFATEMMELEMMDEIILLMKDDAFRTVEAIQKAGLAIIELLITDDSEWRDEVARKGGVVVICDIARRYKDNAEIMCQVMTCMSYLAAEDYIEVMLGQHDALAFVAYVIKTNMMNAELVTRAMLALLNLTACEPHVEELMDKDVSDLCVYSGPAVPQQSVNVMGAQGDMAVDGQWRLSSDPVGFMNASISGIYMHEPGRFIETKAILSVSDMKQDMKVARHKNGDLVLAKNARTPFSVEKKEQYTIRNPNAGGHFLIHGLKGGEGLLFVETVMEDKRDGKTKCFLKTTENRFVRLDANQKCVTTARKIDKDNELEGNELEVSFHEAHQQKESMGQPHKLTFNLYNRSFQTSGDYRGGEAYYRRDSPDHGFAADIIEWADGSIFKRTEESVLFVLGVLDAHPDDFHIAIITCGVIANLSSNNEVRQVLARSTGGSKDKDNDVFFRVKRAMQIDPMNAVLQVACIKAVLNFSKSHEHYDKMEKHDISSLITRARYIHKNDTTIAKYVDFFNGNHTRCPIS
jgi:hypothetical protein